MSVLRGFWAEWLRRLREKVIVATWALATVLLAVTGPFGNYALMSFPERLLLWGGLTGLAIWIGLAIAICAEAILKTDQHWPAGVISAFGVMVIMSPLIREFSARFSRVTGETAPAFGEVELFVFCLSFGVCSVRALVERRAKMQDPGAVVANIAQSEVESVVQTPEPRLLKRVAAQLKGPILWISVNDHYVDVQTSMGSSSLLMRFSDALDELDAAKGLRVHRSHWVADEAVATVVRDGGKLVIVTKDGAHIPVSRTYRAAVEARFLAQIDAVSEDHD